MREVARATPTARLDSQASVVDTLGLSTSTLRSVSQRRHTHGSAEGLPEHLLAAINRLSNQLSARA